MISDSFHANRVWKKRQAILFSNGPAPGHADKADNLCHISPSSLPSPTRVVAQREMEKHVPR